MDPLNIRTEQIRYRVMVGTGGIGSGLFFALNGNHTLGREESRSGRFLDQNDYCKLHIISHYVQTLLGPACKVLPVGRVGDDEPGQRLLAEMAADGLDLTHVRKIPGEQTLFCVCFLYPDGSGGNLTMDDSACAKVDAGMIQGTESVLATHAGAAMVLAVPEVPMEARMALLRLGTKHGCMRAASFPTEEMEQVRTQQILQHVDLLAINIDEAAALGQISAEGKPAEVVQTAVDSVRALQPDIKLSVTAGKHGSWVWDGDSLHHHPIHTAEMKSTAGAGDAHFSGLLVGLAAGLSLEQAHELAVLVGALSVTSPSTINKEICRNSLRVFAESLSTPPTAEVMAILKER